MTKPQTVEPAGAIAALQRRLRRALQGLHHPPLGSAAALTEEVGELVKPVVDHHCYGRPFDREAFEGELADVFICLCELATLHDVELEQAVLKKIAAVEAKAPKWRATLGESLKAAWRGVHGDAAKNPDAAAAG